MEAICCVFRKQADRICLVILFLNQVTFIGQVASNTEVRSWLESLQAAESISAAGLGEAKYGEIGCLGVATLLVADLWWSVSEGHPGRGPACHAQPNHGGVQQWVPNDRSAAASPNHPALPPVLRAVFERIIGGVERATARPPPYTARQATIGPSCTTFRSAYSFIRKRLRRTTIR